MRGDGYTSVNFGGSNRHLKRCQPNRCNPSLILLHTHIIISLIILMIHNTYIIIINTNSENVYFVLLIITQNTCIIYFVIRRHHFFSACQWKTINSLEMPRLILILQRLVENLFQRVAINVTSTII